MIKHPRIATWQREEDGSYKSELAGFTLHVKWRPESKEARRGFLWQVEGPGGAKREAEDVDEEIEISMAHAEEVARRAAAGLD